MTAFPLSASDLAGRLGLVHRARSWRGDCPACSYARAFSVRAGRTGRPLLFCANGCGRTEIDDAISRIAGECWRVPAKAADVTSEAAKASKQAMALRTWDGAMAAAGTIVGTYLAGRALPGLEASAALRYRADTSHPEGGRRPAMIGLVLDASGAPIAVHRTYLAPDGHGKADVDPQRASLGPLWGGAIRLDPVAAELVIGEGIETSASAGRLLNLPAWAALSAGNLGRGLVLPEVVRRVTIAVDPDPAGERAAQEAATRWQAEGRKVRIARPGGAEDFNDVLQAQEQQHAA